MDSDSFFDEAYDASTSFDDVLQKPETHDDLMSFEGAPHQTDCPCSVCQPWPETHNPTIYGEDCDNLFLNDCDTFFPDDFDFGVSDHDLFGLPPVIEALPLPLYPLDEGDVLDSTTLQIYKVKITASHKSLPGEYHELAKELDEGLGQLLKAIGVTRRFMEGIRKNDPNHQYRPIRWSNRGELLATQCEGLKAGRQRLEHYDGIGYSLLCQTVDYVTCYMNCLCDEICGMLSNHFGEDEQIMEGACDYRILEYMRRAIVQMRLHELHKFAMAEGTKCRPRWVRQGKGERLFSTNE